VKFKVSITKTHLRISWELVENPLGNTKHTLGAKALDVWLNNSCFCCETHEIDHIKPCGKTLHNNEREKLICISKGKR